ncbi:MAG: tetratricopeptide repeat protein [bacterium]|nr:tetratricopeptide repeat protein [bacterium]
MWHTRFMALSYLLLICLLACGQSQTTPTADAQSEESDRTRADLQRAGQYLSDKQYSKAISLAWETSQSEAIGAAELQRAAEIVFLAGDSKRSVQLFDRVSELDPSSEPFNWQRGIALCSQGDFERGADQFQSHHQVNPDDVENSAWYFLCVAKTKGVDAAREMVIPSRGDSRQPMMSVLQMLKGEIEPEQVMQAAIDSTVEGPQRKRAQFYADLYIGLFFDSIDQPEKAKLHLKRSLGYDQTGYMADTARVYLADRFADSDSGN